MNRTLSICLLALLAVAAMPVFVGCTKNILTCPPGSAVKTKVIRFICPRCGAEYEVDAIKCAGDAHYRLDTTCPVCGYNYRYSIPRWPYPYLWDQYYFYNGFWYEHDYWNRYWAYGYHAPVAPVPTPPRTTRPPGKSEPPHIPEPPIRQPQPTRNPAPPIRQPQPPRRGNIQRPPVPFAPPAPIVRNPAPVIRPPSPPPVTVRPTPEPEAPPARR